MEDHNPYLGAVWIAAGIFTFIANVLVVVALSIYFHSFPVSRVYIVSLAVADTLLGMTMVLQGVDNLEHADDSDSTEHLLCLPTFFIYYTGLMASNFHMCLIAFDRYLYIMHPLRYDVMVSGGRLGATVVVIWGLAILSGSLALLIYQERGHCSHVSVVGVNRAYTMSTLFFLFVITTSVLYYLIARKARHHQRLIQRTLDSTGHTLDSERPRHLNEAIQLHKVAEDLLQSHSSGRWKRNSNKVRRSLHKMQRSMRTLKMFTVTVGLFFVCWFPMVVTSLTLAVSGKGKEGNLFRETFMLIALCQSAANVFLYSFFDKHFRHAICRTLRCTRCSRSTCRERPNGERTSSSFYKDDGFSYPTMSDVDSALSTTSVFTSTPGKEDSVSQYEVNFPASQTHESASKTNMSAIQNSVSVSKISVTNSKISVTALQPGDNASIRSAIERAGCVKSKARKSVLRKYSSHASTLLNSAKKRIRFAKNVEETRADHEAGTSTGSDVTARAQPGQSRGHPDPQAAPAPCHEASNSGSDPDAVGQTYEEGETEQSDASKRDTESVSIVRLTDKEGETEQSDANKRDTESVSIVRLTDKEGKTEQSDASKRDTESVSIVRLTDKEGETEQSDASKRDTESVSIVRLTDKEGKTEQSDASKRDTESVSIVRLTDKEGETEQSDASKRDTESVSIVRLTDKEGETEQSDASKRDTESVSIVPRVSITQEVLPAPHPAPTAAPKTNGKR
ncbi:alpha-1D adrenergic receptor-like [Littorina saxatilis]|uniref:alpha-1D adrenergic receptor-like n=1 Tax=Littorina saxatilis TaxID=31220 RepID=UPI0038B6630E